MEMENHPIPLDVTGFKFRLIGSMTVKQFLYLLASGILVSLTLLLPWPLLIRVPMITFFSLVGFSLAFIPIDGRPMDKMIASFAKHVLFTEDLWVYRKKGANIASYEIFQEPKVETKPAPQEPSQPSIRTFAIKKPHVKLEQEELDFLKRVRGFFSESAVQQQPVINSTTSSPHPTQTEGEEALKIRTEIQQIKNRVEVEGPTEELKKRLTELEARLSNILAQNIALQNKVFEFQRQIPDKAYQVEGKPTITPNARLVDSASQVKAGFPMLPDIPNVILGIVKDPRGRILPGIIVEVVDQNNIPVRAFKTNKLGQFAAATPLPNGKYKIIFEDPQKNNEFETIEIDLNGQIFQPLEVISIDQRERLRQELFGKTNSLQN